MAELIMEIVSPDDSSLISGFVEFPARAGKVRGYLSRPGDGKNIPGVIVIHENKGLNGHIRDVARRYAREGFAALAPDCLSRVGGTDRFPSEEKATESIRQLSSDGVLSDLTSAIGFLLDQPFSNGRIGAVGFCWGGGQSLMLATDSRDLSAAVVYYGRNPSPLDLVERISCPVLGNYGEKDAGITSQVPMLEETMKKYGKSFDAKIFPGAGHAFNNNTNPDRYHLEAAGEAWSRTIAFFRRHLND